MPQDPPVLFLRKMTNYRQTNQHFFSTSIDTKINAVVCQLLLLFATENDGNFILDLQIIEIFPGEHDPGPLLQPTYQGPQLLYRGIPGATPDLVYKPIMSHTDTGEQKSTNLFEGQVTLGSSVKAYFTSSGKSYCMGKVGVNNIHLYDLNS